TIKRDEYGNRHHVPIKPKLDRDTGMRYVMDRDGINRIDLGPDEDFLLRRDAHQAQQIATNARQNAKALKERVAKEEKSYFTVANKASELARIKNPTVEQRAQLDSFRRQAEIRERQLKSIRGQYQSINEEAT